MLPDQQGALLPAGGTLPPVLVGGAHCLLLPGNTSGVRAPTPPSLPLHTERRENRSTLLNGAEGGTGPFSHPVIPVRHHLDIYFPEESPEACRGELAQPHSLREEEGETVLRQVLQLGLLCDLRLEPPLSGPECALCDTIQIFGAHFLALGSLACWTVGHLKA